MPIMKNVKESLSLKLNIPIVIIGLLILFVIVQIISRISKENIEANILSETHKITDNFIILGEADNSTANLQRVVSAVASERNIISLRLINNSNNKIIADSHNRFIGKDITIVGSDYERNIYKQYSKNNTNQIVQKSLHNLMYQMVPIHFVDPEINRFRPYTILLIYDKTDILYNEQRLLLYVVSTIAIGMLALFFVVYWLQRKILLMPIKRISETLLKQQEQDDIIEIDVNNNDELGRLSRYYNTLIRSKKDKEKELANTRKYIDGVTSNVPVLLYYVDHNQRFCFANENHIRWFNRNNEDLSGKTIAQAFDDETYEKLSPYIAEAIQKKAVSFDMELPFADGENRSLFITFTPDVDNVNKTEGFFVCIEDRTDLRHAEEKMIEYANELEFKTWALEEAKEEAETSTKTKSEFLANMSHEIRTPINGVLGMLNLLLKETLSDRQKHFAKLAHSSGESLLSLINDILDFSKIEAGKLEIEHIAFNLYEVIGDISDSFVFRIDEKGLKFLLDIDLDVPINVIGDPSRFRQIVTNFFSNAIKFTEQGGVAINVKVYEESDQDIVLDIAVKDSGVGIPEDKQVKLFESFSQVDASTTRHYGGTGLGLAIVKQLAELMDSEVGVDSKVNEGSCFWYRARFGKAKHDQKNSNLHDGKFPYHALIVNDYNNIDVIEKYLDHWGIKVTITKNKNTIMSIVEQSDAAMPIDFILIDTALNSFNVNDLSTGLRSNPRYQNIKLVPVVGVNQISSIEIHQNCHFFGYITKPIKPPELYQICSSIENGEKNLKEGVTHSPETYNRHKHFDAHILLVEDNAINQEVAMGILDSLGYLSEVASNGLYALEALVRRGPEYFQVILMDCQMPAMDGFETTALIRRGKNIRVDEKIPIIAMTANAMKGDREKCLDAGMDDYISKPVDPNVLANKLAYWLGKLESNPHDIEHVEVKPPEGEVLDDKNEIEAAISIWNKDGLYRRVRGKKERAAKLIHMFIDDMPERMEKMENYIAQERSKESGHLAHEIKGIAGNLGGECLSEVAANIEMFGKDNDSKSLRRTFPVLCEQYKLLKDALESELNEIQ